MKDKNGTERGNAMERATLLKDFFRKAWPAYLAAFGFHFAANLIHVCYPQILGRITDRLQAGALTAGLLAREALVLLAVGAGHVVIGAAGMLLIMYTGRTFEKQVRNRLFWHFSRLGERFHAKNGVGRLLNYFMNDVTAVRESIAMGFNAATNAVMLLAASVTMMVLAGIPPGLVAASVLPLLAIPLFVVRFGPRIRDRSLDVQRALGEMTETAEEQFGGIRVTKSFAVEPIMNARFGKTVERIRESQLRLVRLSAFFQAVVPFLGAASLAVAIVLGGRMAVAGRITLGHFVSLTLYVRMLMHPLQQIGNVVNAIQRSRASLKRLNGLLSERPEIADIGRPGDVSFGQAALEVRNLTFRYGPGERPVLRNVSFRVEPGATLGITGRTGSGKTTLAKLILRLIDPPPGTIRIGDADIRELSLESLRTQIGYVPQDGFLFSTTIRENIAFHKRDEELAAVERAARQACIYDSIVRMEHRFDTRLGERGLTLSGGQRQRVSLARGLFKNAPIMILDDSTSAVDAATEQAVIESLRRERKNRTTLIISHRISAIKHADEIIVLDDGEIVQRGTHEALIARPGLYRTFHSIQEEGSLFATGTGDS